MAFLEGWWQLLDRRPVTHILRDLVDIGLVAFLVYRILLVLRGTRALQMVIGLAAIGAINLLAKWAGLVTVVNLLSAVLSSIVLIVVVVFQNDIRRALIRVGDRAWLPGMSRAQETRTIEEVVAAATELARHRVGALIAFEQEANLDEFVVGHGVPLDATVTRELLVTIFQPESMNKLHDGAVILRNFRIVNAGVFFPMPEARNLDASLGTRHRAGLGITEETDAVLVIVSEERGTITVGYRGNLVSNLDGQTLRHTLFRLLGHRKLWGRTPAGNPTAKTSGARAPDSKRVGEGGPASSGSPPSSARAPGPRPSLPSASAVLAPMVPVAPTTRATATPLPVAGLGREDGP